MQPGDKLVETKPCTPHEDATFTADHAGQAALTPAQDKLQGKVPGTPIGSSAPVGGVLMLSLVENCIS
ncbi:uncharacterized protein N7473_000579 [Penicillium subrubescens]|uniref:Uncharacterized protein n=1 Tax=Penicillium subrubescens TaxID=1316194 RepID=A0A1Q5U7U6_9EURO|nr:uncharacterized protein N7473_000579 [Penicillium subrubescens]KAJ5911276.1 hypothetical protein N7473_000579 [Penicillium subrubescens]OKP08559.1 hypothetical protein PENSUB_5546 [Penicillium subrubescens]